MEQEWHRYRYFLTDAGASRNDAACYVTTYALSLLSIYRATTQGVLERTVISQFPASFFDFGPKLRVGRFYPVITACLLCFDSHNSSLLSSS